MVSLRAAAESNLSEKSAAVNANIRQVPELSRFVMDNEDEISCWGRSTRSTNTKRQKPRQSSRWLQFRNQSGMPISSGAIRVDIPIDSISWSLDGVFSGSSSWWSLANKAWALLYAPTVCLAGMARVLFPMILAQRVFLKLYEAGQDWYMGRYLRLTFERVGRQYKTRYQVPAILRSVGRLVTHLTALFLLGDLMDWMVGLSHAPCQMSKNNGGGCHFWCALLWIMAATGTGHSAGVAMAIWGRGLRIQVADACSDKIRPSGHRLLRRPLLLARWMYDPAQYFREILARDRRDPAHALKPFDTDWRLFPATWRSLRILQLVAFAKEMYGSDFRSFMRRVLIQQALGDEWFRVLMCEKRVALAMAVMIGYLLSTLGLFASILYKPAISVSSVSILFAAPSVVAVALSAWMNFLECFSRQEQKLTAPSQDTSLAIESYKRITVPVNDRLQRITVPVHDRLR